MNLGIDFSSGRPTAAQVRAAGYRFVCRYVSHSSWKNITRPEFAMFENAGIQVVLNWETTKGRPLSGHGAGVVDAREALGMARQVSGQPNSTRPIYFSMDTDASTGQISGPVADYYRGVASVLGVQNTAAYGEYDLLRYLFDHDLIAYGWQTTAWSHGAREPRAHMFQRLGQVTVGGTTCDVNEQLREDIGAWTEDDMPSADEIAAAVWKFPIKNAPTGTVMSAAGRLLDVERKLNWENMTSLIRSAGTDVDKLAAVLAPAIAAEFPAGLPGGVTAEEVEAAVRRVLREGVDA